MKFSAHFSFFLVLVILSTSAPGEESKKDFFPFGGNPKCEDMATFGITIKKKGSNATPLKTKFVFYVREISEDGNYKVKIMLLIPGPDEDVVVPCRSFHELLAKCFAERLDISKLDLKEDNDEKAGTYAAKWFEKSAEDDAEPVLSIDIQHDFNDTMWGVGEAAIQVKDAKAGGGTVELVWIDGQKDVKEKPKPKEPSSAEKLETRVKNCLANDVATMSKFCTFDEVKKKLDRHLELLPFMEEKKGDLDKVLLNCLFEERLMYPVFASYAIMALKKEHLIEQVLVRMEEAGSDAKYHVRNMGVLLGYYGGHKYFPYYERLLVGGSDRARRTVLVALEFVNFNYSRPARPVQKKADLDKLVKTVLAWFEKNRNKNDVGRLNENIDKVIQEFRGKVESAPEDRRNEMISALNARLLLLSGAAELGEKLNSNIAGSVEIWAKWRKENPKVKNMPKREELFDRYSLYKWIGIWEKDGKPKSDQKDKNEPKPDSKGEKKP
ncbi:MAG: hypothetical protein ACYS8W_07980 [Planctomycetota bacterium]|jgi:hypothetical protein